VYYGTVAQTVEIAGVLGGVCYYCAVGSIEDKKKIVYPRALNAPSPGWIIRVRDRIYTGTR
jgi:hypothetical protein